ncbi:hypothetical protein [Helicobacter himalayensis]|uniref:hypothetical protein n=1 Tax=Helicobacter himalayensis TaxID=1591088 RepID=UPI00082C66E4|nr:hypothetical protein [Helicobacter himalayensis]
MGGIEKIVGIFLLCGIVAQGANLQDSVQDSTRKLAQDSIKNLTKKRADSTQRTQTTKKPIQESQNIKKSSTQEQNMALQENDLTDGSTEYGALQDLAQKRSEQERRKSLKPLDYSNLFSKPPIEWGKIASEKSGFFVGVGGALTPTIRAEDGAEQVYRADYPLGYGYDLKLGFMYFSNPYVGFRLYGQYANAKSSEPYTSARSTLSREYQVSMYSVGLSVILDTTLGSRYEHAISVAIDVSYSPKIDFQSRWSDEFGNSGVNAFKTGNKIVLGLGLGYVYRSKHRLEVMFKRFTDIKEGVDSFVAIGNNAPIVFNQLLGVSIGYSYVF